RPARLLRLHLRQRLFGERDAEPVREAKTREEPDGGDVMAGIFKALSVLLTYPTKELQEAVQPIGEAIEREAGLPARIREQIHALVAEIAAGDLYDLQERYVLLFDRTRSLSLHLFEHVHGEGRDRGQDRKS